MGLETFLAYVESSFGTTSKPVDLLDLANKHKLSSVTPACNLRPDSLWPMTLVVDGECCLDRFYGGYYSDWISGGQWNRMVAFVSNLSKACKFFGLQLTVCLRGGVEVDHAKEFDVTNEEYKEKLGFVLKHLQTKGTPPPKVWWLPPASLRECLSAALQGCGLSVLCTGGDYYKEVAAYCHSNNCYGVITDNAVFALFRIPRLFAARQLKLTYKGTLETKEYLWDKALSVTQLPEDRMPLCATLLGNHIVSAKELLDFHKNLVKDAWSEADSPVGRKEREFSIISKVIEFVRELAEPANLEFVASFVFKNSPEKTAAGVSAIQRSINYYCLSSQDVANIYSVDSGERNVSGSSSTQRPVLSSCTEQPVKQREQGTPADSMLLCQQSVPDVLACSGYGQQPTNALKDQDVDLTSRLSDLCLNMPSSSIGCSSSATIQDQQHAVNSNVLHIARDRHRKGVMCPWIYQALTERMVRLPMCIEDETGVGSGGAAELPSYVDLYRPLRQGAYALLFNLNKIQFELKRQAEEEGRAVAPGAVRADVKELFYRGGLSREITVTAMPLPWSVPSVESLWLGMKPENKGRRLKAFFQLMKSDVPLLQSSTFVPDHFVFPCCVLRYMLLAQPSRPVLQRHELDAFLAMCTSRVLYDVQTMQDMQIPFITTRGVQLAALFMAGVQHATLVNDVCGAPVVREAAQPWLYFDGKLFQYKLLKAINGALPLELCDGQVDQLAALERLRQAVLEAVPEPTLVRQGGGMLSSGGGQSVASSVSGNPLTNGPLRHPGAGGMGSSNRSSSSTSGGGSSRGMMASVRNDRSSGGGGSSPGGCVPILVQQHQQQPPSLLMQPPPQPHHIQLVLRSPPPLASAGGHSAVRGGGGGLLGEYRQQQQQQPPQPPPHYHHGAGASFAVGVGGAAGNSSKLLTNLSGGQLQIAGQVVASWGPNVAAAVGRSAGVGSSAAAAAAQHGLSAGLPYAHLQHQHSVPVAMPSVATAAATSHAGQRFAGMAMLPNYHYGISLYQGAPAILSSSRAIDHHYVRDPSQAAVRNKMRGKKISPQKVMLQNNQPPSSPKVMQILNGTMWQQSQASGHAGSDRSKPAIVDGPAASSAAQLQAQQRLTAQPDGSGAAACTAAPSDQVDAPFASSPSRNASDSSLQGSMQSFAPSAETVAGGTAQELCIA